MARLRKFVACRNYKRPYTRYSKYRKHSFVRARPANRISRYTSGTQADYGYEVHLVSKNWTHVRDNALESARLAILRTVEKVVGKNEFFMQMRVYPHNLIRENPLAAGAGADRLSTGMAHSFGKIVGNSAQIKVGQRIFTVRIAKEHIHLVRDGMRKAMTKLPFKWSVVVEDKSKPPVKVKKTPKKPKKSEVAKEAPVKKAAPKKEAAPKVETKSEPKAESKPAEA